MTLLTIILPLSVLIAISVYILFKRCEIIVCTEVCNIFCNTIVAFDQCVGITREVLKEWHRLSVKASFDSKLEEKDVERIMQLLELKDKNVAEMKRLTPKLTFRCSWWKQQILSHHKLPLAEIELALALPQTTYDELKTMIDETMTDVKIGTIDSMRMNFIQTKFMAFEEETIGMYYGAMEGICSFPHSVLRIYEDVSFGIKYLPTEVGYNKRKEDYLHFQELRMDKAQRLLNEFKVYLDNTDDITKTFTDVLLKKDINMFFSGSKRLEIERNIFNGAIVRLQTKWRKKELNIYGFSYQNFKHEVVVEGHQAAYDTFIQNCTDAIFFVLNGNVGGYTKKEFKLAMEAFKQKGTPKIFVYSKINDVIDSSVEELRKIICEEKQYWQDYTDNSHLKLLIENDMMDVITSINEDNTKIRRNIFE